MSGRTPPWLVFVAARWKAVAAVLVPLIGGLVALWPDSETARVIGVVVTALVAGGAVHQVPNKVPVPAPDGPLEDVEDIVEDVLLPDDEEGGGR